MKDRLHISDFSSSHGRKLDPKTVALISRIAQTGTKSSIYNTDGIVKGRTTNEFSGTESSFMYGSSDAQNKLHAVVSGTSVANPRNIGGTRDMGSISLARPISATDGRVSG